MEPEPIQCHSKPPARAGILPPSQASTAASFQPAAAAASQRLAAGILQRCGLVPSEPASLEPVHLRLPAPSVQLHTTRRYALHLAPHIRLAFTGAAGPTGRAAEPPPGPTLVLQQLERFPDRPAERQRLVETLVERLFARGQRLPSLPAAEPASSRTPASAMSAPQIPTAHPGAAAQEARPVQRVLRMPAAALPPAAAQTSSEARADAVQLTGAQWARQAASPNPAPAPIDIQQITQQVIQTIDRKIIGQRERFGRI